MPWETILDVATVLLLGVTIFYAAKLSLYLKIFRDGRKDMAHLIQDLSASVARAENAIHGMQDSAHESGRELQDIVNQAKFLADELRFMNEAGDSLANRLEKLAERNRELVDLLEQSGGVGHPQTVPMPKAALSAQQISAPQVSVPTRAAQSYSASQPYQQKIAGQEQMPSTPSLPSKRLNTPFLLEDDEETIGGFKIQDRDFDEYFGDPEEDVGLEFQSQAEKDLYDALRRRRAVKKKTGHSA